ncbi:MAG: hypothetical protein ACJZ7A_05785 [Opitutales bacterium]
MFFDSTATEMIRSRRRKVALIIVSFGRREWSNSAEEFRSSQKFPRKPSEAKVTSCANQVRACEYAKSTSGAVANMTKVMAVMSRLAGQARRFKRRRKTWSFPRQFSKRFHEWVQVMSA